MIFMIPSKFFAGRHLLQKLIKNGKKIKAFNIFLKVWKNIRAIKKYKDKPYSVIYMALQNVQPVLGLELVPRVKKKGKGKNRRGQFFNLPRYITKMRAFKLSTHWLVTNLKKRPEKHIVNKLTNEIIGCYEEKPDSLTLLKRQEVYNIMLDHRPFFFILRFRKWLHNK